MLLHKAGSHFDQKDDSSCPITRQSSLSHPLCSHGEVGQVKSTTEQTGDVTCL